MSKQLADEAADIVRQLLLDLGLGTDPDLDPLQAWPVYAKREPTVPDDCLTVYGTAGRDTGRLMFTGELTGFHGFQVRVRSADDSTGWAKANAIQTALAEGVYRDAVTIEATPDRVYFVQTIDSVGDVIPLGTEAGVTSRCLWTINASIDVRQLGI